MIKLRRSLDRMLHLQDLIFWIHILYYMLIKNDSSPRSGTKDIIKKQIMLHRKDHFENTDLVERKHFLTNTFINKSRRHSSSPEEQTDFHIFLQLRKNILKCMKAIHKE